MRFRSASWHRSSSARAWRASASATVTAAPASASAFVARSHSARKKTWSCSAFRLMPHSALTSSCSAAAMRSVSRARSSSSPAASSPIPAHAAGRSAPSPAPPGGRRQMPEGLVNSSVGIGRSGMDARSVRAATSPCRERRMADRLRLLPHPGLRSSGDRSSRRWSSTLASSASPGNACPQCEQVSGVHPSISVDGLCKRARSIAAVQRVILCRAC